jgi:tetratricopeptide (TPR) repeat protein
MVSLQAVAALPAKDIQEAQKMIEAGDPGGALERLQELQVDYPESPEIRFAMACSWFFKGEQALEQGAAPDAAAAFGEAKALFDALRQGQPAPIAREAAFNRANCLLREAQLIDGAQDYAGAVAALRSAVEAFELGIKQYPDHEGMRQNLDYTRYTLKQLLQNPPAGQDQQQPSDQPSPAVISRFNTANTQLPNAKVQYEDNTAILVIPQKEGGKP